MSDMAAFDRIKLLCLKKILTLHSVKVSSSANTPLLLAIVYWGEANRSSLSQMFYEINVVKKFGNFTGKHQCWSLFLLKFQAWTCNFIKKWLQHKFYPVKFPNFLRTYFFTEHLRWLLLNKPKSSLWFIWERDFLVIQHESTLVVQYHVKLVDWMLFWYFIVIQAEVRSYFTYIVDCE